MIFVDSNVPMYLVGATHPHKTDARRLLDQAVLEGRALVTSAEVYQEIIHRYAAIDRRDAIGPAFAVLDHVVDEVASIEHGDVQVARELAVRYPELSARDCLQVGVMNRLGCSDIMSFDTAFDRVPALTRLA